jgi:hypothetical protein
MAELYAALQCQRGEQPHEAIFALMQASVNQGIFFKTLEVLGVLEVGTRSFVRFRTGNADLMQAFKDASLQDRASITPNGTGYKVVLPDGRRGSLPTTKMHMVADPNKQRLYRGPAIELWERQFLDVRR